MRAEGRGLKEGARAAATLSLKGERWHVLFSGLKIKEESAAYWENYLLYIISHLRGTSAYFD